MASYKGLVSVNAMRPAGSAHWPLCKVGVGPPADTRDGDLSFQMTAFQKNGFQVLEKDTPGS